MDNAQGAAHKTVDDMKDGVDHVADLRGTTCHHICYWSIITDGSRQLV
jgi:hypothetical protein